ncbi:MAG: hypothetical protein JRI83_11580, partial [Deltaproteobacteria bacterium]|nr:hypothetical protein [Deltaproteobacteria bacterium]
MICRKAVVIWTLFSYIGAENLGGRRQPLEKIIPQRMFFTKGVGYHQNKLQSFELALRDAGIEICNIVTISSIFPPACKIISK